MPAIFQLMDINNTLYMDGGVMQNLDVGSVVRRCKEQGYSEDQIVLDILLTSSGSEKGWSYSFLNAFQSLFRFLEINHWANSNDDILHAKYDFPNVTFRGIYRPYKKLNTISIQFDPQ
jgi:predicted acylesterase/phospholipase RssA